MSRERDQLNNPIMPQDVFSSVAIRHVLTGDQLCLLEDLFEAICKQDVNRVNRIMGGLAV